MSTDFSISGIHHIGLGVSNLEIMRNYYRDILGFNQVFAEFPQRVHKPLESIIRMPEVIFSGIMLHHGGIIIELIKMINPSPRPIRRDFRYGDIGINKITILVSDIGDLYRTHEVNLNFCSAPKAIAVPGCNKYHFVFCRDPEGNLFELVSTDILNVDSLYASIKWVGISVTNLERSATFYQEILGFKELLIDVHESYSGAVDEISGIRNTRLRSCLLSDAKGSIIELMEFSKPRGRSIPFLTNWGDFGYLQICLNGINIENLANHLHEVKADIISPPLIADDELAPAFIYFRDPDGILLEVMDFDTKH